MWSIKTRPSAAHSPSAFSFESHADMTISKETELIGHNGAVTCMMVQKNTLFSGSKDQTVRVRVCVRCEKYDAAQVTQEVFHCEWGKSFFSLSNRTQIWSSQKKRSWSVTAERLLVWWCKRAFCSVDRKTKRFGYVRVSVCDMKSTTQRRSPKRFFTASGENPFLWWLASRITHCTLLADEATLCAANKPYITFSGLNVSKIMNIHSCMRKLPETRSILKLRV